MGIRRRLTVLPVAFVAVLLAYPNRRIMTYKEIATDVGSHPIFAHRLQGVLGDMWRFIFWTGSHDPHGHVFQALESEMQRQNTTTLVEICAGSGVAGVLWGESFRSRGFPVQIKLTDIQPNLEIWRRLQRQFGDVVQYIPEPTNAFDMPLDLPGVRTMHFALHHFPPAAVERLLADVVRSKRAFLVADLSPNTPSLLASFLGFFLPFVSGPASSGVLDAVFMPFVMGHDSVVSVLRSYSAGQLRDISMNVTGSQAYAWTFFNSRSPLALLLGDWVDGFVFAPLIQWGLFAPRA
jgi:hypothetical protein